jgi:hypothetical protein
MSGIASSSAAVRSTTARNAGSSTVAPSARTMTVSVTGSAP